MTDEQRIAGFLAAVRRAMRRSACLEAALLVATGAGALALATIVLAAGTRHLQAVRLASGAVAVAWLVAVAWTRIVVTWRRTASDLAVATAVERRMRGLHDALVAAVQFGLSRTVAERLGLSSTLVQAAVRRAALQVEGQDPRAFASRGGMGGSGRVLAAVVLAVGAVAVLAPGVLQTGWSRLLYGPPAVAATLRLRLVDVAVTDIRLRYQYPAYTRMPPREVTGTAGDVTAPAGTLVHLRARAEVPVRSALLVVDDGQRTRQVPVRVQHDRQLEAQIQVDTPGTYRFRLMPDDGPPLQERTPHAIDVVADEPPVVELLAPAEDREVHADETVTFAYRSQDDYGIDRIELVYQVPGHDELVRRKVRGAGGQKTHQGSVEFDLAQVPARPGDTIEVWFEATDEDTIAGPKVGRSAVRTLHIWSPERRHDRVVELLAEIAEQMLHLLGDRLESPAADHDAKAAQATLDASGAANAKAAVIVRMLADAVGQMADDPLMPPSVTGAVTAMHQRHRELQQAEAHTLQTTLLAGPSVGRRRARLALLWAHNDENIEALERDILELEDLVDRLRQEKLKNQARDLLAQQDELMRLLDQMRQSGDPDAARRALEQLDALRQQIDAMMQQLARQARRMPYDNFNPGALDPEGTQQDLLDFRQQIERIRELIEQGRLDEAMELAEQLQQQMAEMMATMEEGFEGMPGMGGGGSMSRQALRQIDRELAELARQEADIYEETSEIDERLRQRAMQRIQELLDQFIDEQLERAEALRRRVEAADDAELSDEQQERRGALEETAEEIARMLQQRELDQARRLAEQAAGECDGLSGELHEASDRARRAGRAAALQRAAGQLDEGERIARAIADAIARLMPDPDESMDAADRQQLDALRERQDAARSRLQRLLEQLAQLDRDNPGIQRQFEETLQKAGQCMGGASSALGGHRPRQARGHEQDALDRLGQARKRVQRLMQPRRMAGYGPGLSEDDTEIPDPDDYRVPPEFREEILRAMKENAPRRYRSLIERYYQELIR